MINNFTALQNQESGTNLRFKVFSQTNLEEQPPQYTGLVVKRNEQKGEKEEQKKEGRANDSTNDSGEKIQGKLLDFYFTFFL
jgi:hypothetical protein